MEELDFMPALLEAAEGFKAEIEKTIDSSMDPPNAPSTKRRKGNGKTLVDDGDLLRSIEVRPHGHSAVDVGTFDPKIVKYAALVHDGTIAIPARPYVAKAVDRSEERIFDQFEKRVADEIEAFLD